VTDYLSILAMAQPELAEDIKILRKGLAVLNAFKAKYNLKIPTAQVTTMENAAIGGYYQRSREELKVYLKHVENLNADTYQMQVEDNSVYGILLHEAGHAIADKYLDKEMPFGEKRLSEHDYPDDVSEREAETLRIFIDNEEKLRELNPSRYEYLKNRLKPVKEGV